MEEKKQLDMARARLKAYQVAEEIENEKDPVKDDLSRDSLFRQAQHPYLCCRSPGN